MILFIGTPPTKSIRFAQTIYNAMIRKNINDSKAIFGYSCRSRFSNHLLHCIISLRGKRYSKKCCCIPSNDDSTYLRTMTIIVEMVADNVNGFVIAHLYSSTPIDYEL